MGFVGLVQVDLGGFNFGGWVSQCQPKAACVLQRLWQQWVGVLLGSWSCVESFLGVFSRVCGRVPKVIFGVGRLGRLNCCCQFEGRVFVWGGFGFGLIGCWIILSSCLSLWWEYHFKWSRIHWFEKKRLVVFEVKRWCFMHLRAFTVLRCGLLQERLEWFESWDLPEGSEGYWRGLLVFTVRCTKCSLRLISVWGKFNFWLVLHDSSDLTVPDLSTQVHEPCLCLNWPLMIHLDRVWLVVLGP